MSKITDIFNEIVEDGVITRDEYDNFFNVMQTDGTIDEEESGLISQMFKMIQNGTIKIVDTEREKSELRKKLDTIMKR
ncbi:MAG: hypothetical protein LBE20_03995 [Deltaproteobacteria bacterium]|jgi:hypothetical protein|nr:hypothetical protein [Deltaproteobacteria bacterium]